LRQRYRVKVEVRVYAAMPDKLGFIGVPDAGIIQVNEPALAYRSLVSRAHLRPQGDLYPFDVQEPMPTFPLPLAYGDDEVTVDLNQLLHDLYDRAGYDLSIDYRRDPTPPFEGEDAVWVEELLAPLRK
jgi:hypothetical protein